MKMKLRWNKKLPNFSWWEWVIVIGLILILAWFTKGLILPLIGIFACCCPGRGTSTSTDPGTGGLPGDAGGGDIGTEGTGEDDTYTEESESTDSESEPPDPGEDDMPLHTDPPQYSDPDDPVSGPLTGDPPPEDDEPSGCGTPQPPEPPDDGIIR